MNFERIKTLKLDVDESREIYLMFTTEDDRSFVNIYSAYKDYGTINFEYGMFCDEMSDKTKDEDIETDIIEMVINHIQTGEIQWPELSDKDMEFIRQNE